MLLSFN